MKGIVIMPATVSVTAGPAAHDLVWCHRADALQDDAALRPAWLAATWSPQWPLVVRRAPARAGLLPVGVRGRARNQRHAAWLERSAVCRCTTPQQLAAARGWHRAGPRADLPALTALAQVAPRLDRLGLDWGITGGAGFELACGRPVLRPDSDLDLLIRCPQPVSAQQAGTWLALLAGTACRIDVQLETPAGGVALAEWARGGRCLVKRTDGPCLVDDPWQAPLP